MTKRTHFREIEEQAALYALGALAPDEAGSFQARLSAGCSLCRAALEDCRDAVSALPLAAPDVAPRPELRQRLLERIGVTEGATAPKASIGTLVRPDDTAWERSAAPGVETRALLGRKTMLVRMAPGTSLPQHEHRFGEQCLVLEGSIRSDDMVAHAGDFTFMPAGSTHSQLYSDTGCLLLIAYT
jgi:hypothetical protein